MKRRPRMSTSIYLSHLLLVLLSVLLTGSICLHIAITNKQQDLDAIIQDTARMVAGMEPVREALQEGAAPPVLTGFLDQLCGSMEYVDVLVLCDKDSTRLYHTVAARVGERFVGGDQSAILKEGAAPYISVAVGTMGLQRRAFHAVTDADGHTLGFVMASVLNDHLTRIRWQIVAAYLGAGAVLVALGLISAAGATYSLRRVLLGHQPEEFTHLFLQRDEVLNALDDGLLAINDKGSVILMNQAAKSMLHLPPDAQVEGQPLQPLHPQTHLPAVLRSGQAEYNVDSVIGGRNIITSRIPIRAGGRVIGAVSIFRDKTEVTKLAEQLTGANYAVDTLRACNHEFMNKLHVILGLLETGDVEGAKRYIMGTSLVSGAAVSDITRRVPIANLAALLIGKLLRASELGIQLTLKPDSYFRPKAQDLPADSYITLVGNLVDNAMDELNTGDHPAKEIELGIYSGEGHTTIVCDDTGGGIPPAILDHIYERGVTTKGSGHGTGLALIKQTVDRYEGSIDIDTESGKGTSIEITLPL